MAILPPSIFFVIGTMDLLMTKQVWRVTPIGWKYGIGASILVLVLTSVSPLLLLKSHVALLYIIIDFFSLAELVVLLTPDSR